MLPSARRARLTCPSGPARTCARPGWRRRPGGPHASPPRLRRGTGRAADATGLGHGSGGGAGGSGPARTPGAPGTARSSLPPASGAGRAARGGRAGPRQRARDAGCPIRLGSASGGAHRLPRPPPAAIPRRPRRRPPHQPCFHPLLLRQPPDQPTLLCQPSAKPGGPPGGRFGGAHARSTPAAGALCLGLGAAPRQPDHPPASPRTPVSLCRAPSDPLAPARCHRLASRPIPRLRVLDQTRGHRRGAAHPPAALPEPSRPPTRAQEGLRQPRAP